MSVVHLFDRTASIFSAAYWSGSFYSSQLGLFWRSHVFGIALGVGIIASASLAAAAIRFQTRIRTPLLELFSDAGLPLLGAYLDFLSLCSRAKLRARRLPRHDMETWNLELERLLKQ